MIPSEITNYCEIIAIYNKDIAKKVAEKRREMYEKRLQYGLSANLNPEDIIVPVVTLNFFDGSKLDILDPVPWLHCYKKTKNGYRKFIEESIPEALELYYDKGMLCTQSYTRAGVSRTKFFEQRRKFVWLFSLYALQDHLITLEE